MENKRKDYDKNHGRVLGMSNNGYSYREIARATALPLWRVIDIIQVAYGRDVLYGTRRAES